jgi:hypothetical protein
MTFPRHYPQTYGSGTWVKLIKIFEPLSSVVSSTPRMAKRMFERMVSLISTNIYWNNYWIVLSAGVNSTSTIIKGRGLVKALSTMIDSTSVTARGIKKTLVNIYGMFLRTYALSYPASYPRMRDAYYDIIKQVSISTVDRAISKQTTTIINLIASKPLSVFRDVSVTVSSISTRISNIVKHVQGCCPIASSVPRRISKYYDAVCGAVADFKWVNVYQKIVSASSSVVGWVDQYIFTWAKLVERSVVSSVLQIQRGISKSVNPLIDGTVSVWRWVGKSVNTLLPHISSVPRWVSKTNVSNIISFSNISRLSRRFVVSGVGFVSSITKRTLKLVSGYVVGIGTTAKTFITGFVKKMFTYPADPEFKVEEDE